MGAYRNGMPNVVRYSSLTCGYGDYACTVSASPHYRTPDFHAQCAYCKTRYYLGAGDKMNCTQCGAPL